MNKFYEIFPKLKTNIVGMIHVKPTLGTPRNINNVNELVDMAQKEAEIYAKYKIDALLIENMHDIPYIQEDQSGPELTSVMTAVCLAVKKLVPHIPVGIQILAGQNKSALAVAVAANLQFIRAESFVYGHIADEGYMNACAGMLLRYRKLLKAENVAIFTDIKKKHSSHAITSDVSLVETAKTAEFFDSNGVILTGTSTGNPPEGQDLKDLLRAVNIPVLVGSGVTLDNLEEFQDAHAIIIGSYFKKGGRWENHLDERHISSFMRSV